MIKTVYSSNPQCKGAAAELKEKIGDFDVKMLVFFASRKAYEPDEIAACVKDAFPGAEILGCSSNAEVTSGKTLYDSISAMAFDSDTIQDLNIQVVENISKGIDINAVFGAFGSYFGVPMAKANYKEYCGLILIDGLSFKEVEIMDKIGSHTNIMFVGGSASDNMTFKDICVYANGKAYRDAAVLCVFKAKSGMRFIKTQSMDIMNTVLTVTKGDKSNFIVYEFDGKPAAQRYAEILGIEPKDAADHIFAHPLGLVIDSDIYVRAFRRGEGDSFSYTVNMPEKMKVNMLQIRDMLPDTKAAIDAVRKETGNITGILEFRCVYRVIQLEKEGKLEAYDSIFDGIPMAGFSTYGEMYYGNVNHSSVMIVFTDSDYNI